MSFRLWTIFYVFALLASALAAFGAVGINVAAIMLGIWGIVFYLRKSSVTLLRVALTLVVFGVLTVFLLPDMLDSREATRRDWCLGLVKQLALAVLNFESARHRFPSAYLSGDDALPLCSWRVQVLPYLCLRPDKFDFSKAWDNPVNWPVSSTPHELVQCPSDASPKAITDYYAVIGPDTAWPGSVVRRMADIKDGADQTILLVESRGVNANWAEPRDLTFEEAVTLLTSPVSESDGHLLDNGFFYKPSYGRCVAFVDGHAEFIHAPLSRELAAALLTVDGGEHIPDGWNRGMRPELDYKKFYVFGLFVFLSVLPAAWVRRRKSPARARFSAEMDGPPPQPPRSAPLQG